MKQIITYKADDGTAFETENDCIKYELDQRAAKSLKVQKEMKDLDIKIWNYFYPDSSDLQTEHDINLSGICLKEDIIQILSDEGIEYETAKSRIMSMIQDSECAEDILKKYIIWDNVEKIALVKRDYFTAFKRVREGSDLTSIVGYFLSNQDLRKLAKLHKENKFRKRIEAYLTDCNFHYECGKFMQHEYDEFI